MDSLPTPAVGRFPAVMALRVDLMVLAAAQAAATEVTPAVAGAILAATLAAAAAAAMGLWGLVATVAAEEVEVVAVTDTEAVPEGVVLVVITVSHTYHKRPPPDHSHVLQPTHASGSTPTASLSTLSLTSAVPRFLWTPARPTVGTRPLDSSNAGHSSTITSIRYVTSLHIPGTSHRRSWLGTLVETTTSLLG